jgi:TAG lipase/steryl ester hydrolase/phospholipase A2/LPA acyltransferase
MVSARRTLTTLARDVANAATYAEWCAAAAAFDAHTGADAPPDDALSRLLASERASLVIRPSEDPFAAAKRLTDSLYRTLGDLGAAAVYDDRLLGVRDDVRAYLDAAERALDALCAAPGVPTDVKCRLFEDAAATFGRSGLLLSGGATLGFHHLGVIKALFDQDLLPDVISGASTGAMIGGGLAVRTNDEIRALYADLDQIRREGLVPAPLRDRLRNRAWLDPAALEDVLRNNIGPYTFEEGFRRSGRVLAIAVSPNRAGQRARLLCHKTAPDVLVARAAVASSALPGLFPPMELLRRGPAGAEEPYLPGERWVDGSIRHDLPMMRLARLHNVNHFVVSQTNPHVLPFVATRGGVGFALGLVGHSARMQSAGALEVARRITGGSPLRTALDHLHALVAQEYRGDIDIHPRLRPRAWLRVVSNPTRAELDAFVLEGQRATWPHIGRIQDQTRIRSALARCVARLRG